MPVRRMLERRLGRSVVLANDANAGLYGEAAFGAAVKSKDGLLAGVFVGTGVGGALMAGGRLIEGAVRLRRTGEIGHVTLAPDGPRCGCGNRGCLEALASRSAVVRRIGKRIARGRRSLLAGEDMEEVGSAELARAWRRGDRPTVKEVRAAGRWLGIGVAGLVNLLNPDAVVLGGGFLEALGRPVFRIIAEEARRRALAAPFRGAALLLSQLGDLAVPLVRLRRMALAPVRASRR